MKNIFENAYFGKAYKTRDGRKAIYIDFEKALDFNEYHYLIIEGIPSYTAYKDDGIRSNNKELDIVSEWQEPLDEEKLNKLAALKGTKSIVSFINKTPSVYEWADKVKDSYKEAYRKGWEDKQ